MLTTTLLALASSLYIEAVKWLDRRLQGTFVAGNGAVLLSFLLAFVAAAFKILLLEPSPAEPTTFQQDMVALWSTVTEIWTVSQVYYHFIAKTFGIRVTTTPNSTDPIL